MAGIPGIIYPPTMDFDFLVQRPQQLLKSLSSLGVMVYYINRLPLHYKQLKGIEQYNDHLFLFNHCQPINAILKESQKR